MSVISSVFFEIWPNWLTQKVKVSVLRLHYFCTFHVINKCTNIISLQIVLHDTDLNSLFAIKQQKLLLSVCAQIRWCCFYGVNSCADVTLTPFHFNLSQFMNNLEMQGLEYYNILKFWCISNEKHIKETSMEHIDEVICERILDVTLTRCQWL